MATSMDNVSGDLTDCLTATSMGILMKFLQESRLDLPLVPSTAEDNYYSWARLRIRWMDFH